MWVYVLIGIGMLVYLLVYVVGALGGLQLFGHKCELISGLVCVLGF